MLAPQFLGMDNHQLKVYMLANGYILVPARISLAVISEPDRPDYVRVTYFEGKTRMSSCTSDAEKVHEAYSKVLRRLKALDKPLYNADWLRGRVESKAVTKSGIPGVLHKRNEFGMTVGFYDRMAERTIHVGTGCLESEIKALTEKAKQLRNESVERYNARHRIGYEVVEPLYRLSEIQFQVIDPCNVMANYGSRFF